MSDLLFLPKLPTPFRTQVMTCYRTQNVQSKSDQRHVEYNLAVYKADPDHKKWVLQETKEYENDFCIFKDSDYSLKDCELLIIVPIAKGEVPLKETDVLPKPISKKTSRAPVNERGTIRISSEFERTCYQGEYPYNMSQIPRGSLISFPSFSQNNLVSTKSIIINVQSNVKDWKTSKGYLINYETKRVIKTFDMHANMATCVEIPAKDQSKLFIYSTCLTGIPLYLQHDQDYKNLSLEHTHPPSEYFYGKDKITLQKVLKKNWIELANSIIPELS